MRIALVHDWLNGMRGGEKVFEVLCEIFPNADVHTLIYEPAKVSPVVRAMNVIESAWVRRLPVLRKRYRYLLPFMPAMAEALPIRGYDAVISTSHCVAKGVIPRPETTPHISYCFTPMRYVWDKFDDYFGDRLSPSALAMRVLREPLQQWDAESSARVTHFLTSSNYVRQRIREHYMRESQVIPAPVDFERFASAERNPEDFYLVVSALEPYKRIDVAVEAFNRLGLPLKVAGSGTQFEKLSRLAKPNVEMLGWVDDRSLVSLMSTAKALVFPADEDFGIVPLEAMAAGCPVVAYGHGGAMETIVDGVTGVFFPEQDSLSLIEALDRMERIDFRPDVLRNHASQFDRAIFKQKLKDSIYSLLNVAGRVHSSARLQAVRVNTL